MTTVQENNQTKVDPIAHLFSEASLIQDPMYREFTQLVLAATDENSWKGISGYNHHLPDEREAWGNYIHTIRVLRIVMVLANLLDLPQVDRDILRASAILHDSCKHGVDGTYEKILTREHADLVRELVAKADVPYSPLIRDCVEQHMGRWGHVECDWIRGRSITLPFLLHVADCVESNLPDVMDVKL